LQLRQNVRGKRKRQGPLACLGDGRCVSINAATAIICCPNYNNNESINTELTDYVQIP